jgi:hypothetical protein
MDRGSILMPLNGTLVTMETYYASKGKRHKPCRLFCSLVGIGFILATMFLMMRLDDVARWIAGVTP